MLQEIADILSGTLKFFRKRKPLRHTDTGVGTTFKTLALSAPFKLLEVRFHLGSVLAATETLTLTRTSLVPLHGPMLTYVDYVILSEDLGTLGAVDLVKTFGPEEGLFTKDDSIVPALSANAGADRWGLEILYELV